jgi:hypothetical protein
LIAAPVAAEPVTAVPAAAEAQTNTPVATPEAMLGAAVPPPIVVLPPTQVMIEAGPPPLVFSAPPYAMTVWPEVFFIPPMLAVAVLHDDWWTTRYRGRGGYYAGGYYAGGHYVSQGYAERRAIMPIAAIGLHGRGFWAARTFGWFGHGGGHVERLRSGRQGGEHGHGR